MSLFTKEIQEHLTPAPFDRNARATYPDQAHFAGTGPATKTCRECLSFDHGKYDYFAKNGKWRGLIKPASCRKYRQLTHDIGPTIPDDAMACKYFEQNETPPARFEKSS